MALFQFNVVAELYLGEYKKLRDINELLFLEHDPTLMADFTTEMPQKFPQ